eukprot:gene997-1961_t
MDEDDDESISMGCRVDFAALSGHLSEDTLLALRAHLAGDKDNEQEDADHHVNNKSVDAIVNSDYKLKSYWDERFSDEESFEWLLPYSDLKNFIDPIFTKNMKRALVIGCGNSSFSADLYDSGVFEGIVNIDYSDTVIEKMKALHEIDRPRMTWITMDMLHLEFDSSSFDIVIDKATMDALMVDEGDVWNPQTNVIESVHVMCAGISQVLVPGGVFLQISFAQPHFRTKYLMNIWKSDSNINPYDPTIGFCSEYDWMLSYKPIELEKGCLSYFMYIMSKSNSEYS